VEPLLVVALLRVLDWLAYVWFRTWGWGRVVEHHVTNVVGGGVTLETCAANAHY
jgi:hypothetical protein